MLESVVQEVGEDARQRGRVGERHVAELAGLDGQLDAAPLSERLPRRRGGVDGATEIDGFGLESPAAALERGEVEQVFDQGSQAGALGFDNVAVAAPGIGFELFTGQHLGVHPQAGQRRLELVGHVGDEVVPQSSRVAFAGKGASHE